MTNDLHLTKHASSITSAQRATQNKHRGAVVWFTGLSGAGKSSLAYATEHALFHQGCHIYVLDGDNVRHGLCADLAFSDADRRENIRRISEVVKLFMEAGQIVLCAFISPNSEDRNKARNIIGDENFIEVYCSASLASCEKRDTKGLYKKAREGAIKNFTGISSPFQTPKNPDLTLDINGLSVEACVSQICNTLKSKMII